MFFLFCFFNFKANLKGFPLWEKVVRIMSNRPFFSFLVWVGRNNSLAQGGTMQHRAAEAQPYLHTECSGNCLPAVFCVYASVYWAEEFFHRLPLAAAVKAVRSQLTEMTDYLTGRGKSSFHSRLSTNWVVLGGIKCTFQAWDCFLWFYTEEVNASVNVH